MIININKLPLFSRYNGGWIKTIKQLNKKKKNGYSLIGDFLPVSAGRFSINKKIDFY